MKNIVFALLLLPLVSLAQKSDTAKLLTAGKIHLDKQNKGWIFPGLGWHYKVGDNPEWAKPEFSHASWKTADLEKLPYGSTEIPYGSIVWLRVKIKNDSSFAQPLILRVYQAGASEIYLDGKLIHRFGVISKNPDSSSFYNPNKDNLAFPLVNDSTQVLAVRFLNLSDKYPVFLNGNFPGFFLSVAKANYTENDFQVQDAAGFGYKITMVFGATLLLAILFLTLYFFFKTQKVNLFFSLCCFCLALYMAFIFTAINFHGNSFLLDLPTVIFCVSSLTLLEYSVYKALDKAQGLFFRVVIGYGIIAIPGCFIVDGGLLCLVLAIVVSADGLRISTLVLKRNKAGGGRILQICFILNLLFWPSLLLSNLNVVSIPSLMSYSPFAYFIVPLGLAIYIGYSFGATSQTLRQKLNEVEILSGEKQQILAAQNETLEKQVTERTAALNYTLQDLKATQAQLIQSEKMASLGELTAGIAHEIQNPLNFVNNFSDLNKELIDEMNIEIDNGNLGEVKIIASDIKSNEEKINHHGKRADAIVKGMLQHSRSGSNIKEPTNVNALADEYLRLAYQGLRAKDNSFNAVFKTDFDATIEKINIVPQDIGRVLLNLYTNAFYAVRERQKSAGEDYQPTVSVNTKKTDSAIEISVADNGSGIANTIVNKIFQPFFTTKPTGQGTGLGLSLSYDIVKAHGGEIKVKTAEGDSTKFTILLPDKS